MAGKPIPDPTRNVGPFSVAVLREEIAMAGKPIPDGYHSVTPYLHVRGGRVS